jgi:hypothetical protein
MRLRRRRYNTRARCVIGVVVEVGTLIVTISIVAERLLHYGIKYLKRMGQSFLTQLNIDGTTKNMKESAGCGGLTVSTG